MSLTIFFLTDATDRSKISSDQKHCFIAFSLLGVFFANTPFNDSYNWAIFLTNVLITIVLFTDLMSFSNKTFEKTIVFPKDPILLHDRFIKKQLDGKWTIVLRLNNLKNRTTWVVHERLKNQMKKVFLTFPSVPLTKCIVYTCQTVWPSYLIYCAGQSRQLRNRCWNLERTYFVFVILCISVVNALLHKGFSNPYQSRYNSISLYYQCQTGHNLELSMSNRTQSWAINVKHGHNLELSMSNRAQSWAINVKHGHDLINYHCQTLGTILSD